MARRTEPGLTLGKRDPRPIVRADAQGVLESTPISPMEYSSPPSPKIGRRPGRDSVHSQAFLTSDTL